MASQRAARQLRDLTALWVSADSARPAANEAHALALEENGEVRASLSGENALWHVRRALHLLRQEDASDTSVSAARLRVSEVRLLLKRGNFEAAHDSAAVVLSRSSSLSASATREVLPLAALLGRVGELEALVRRAEPNSAMLSPQMLDVPGIQVAMSEQELLLTTITMGMPGDEIASRFARLERALELNVPAGERPRVRSQLLSEVFYLGLLVLPDGAEDGASQLQAPIMQVQLQLRAGERERAGAVVRAKLDEMRSRGSSPWPSEWLLTARIALAYGDSTAAVEMLDRGLAALPRTSSNILSLPHVAASIPAMAALRARLGSVDGAAAEAVRWSEAAAALRRTADAPLTVPPSDAP